MNSIDRHHIPTHGTPPRNSFEQESSTQDYRSVQMSCATFLLVFAYSLFPMQLLTRVLVPEIHFIDVGIGIVVSLILTVFLDRFSINEKIVGVTLFRIALSILSFTYGISLITICSQGILSESHSYLVLAAISALLGSKIVFSNPLAFSASEIGKGHNTLN